MQRKNRSLTGSRPCGGLQRENQESALSIYKNCLALAAITPHGLGCKSYGVAPFPPFARIAKNYRFPNYPPLERLHVCASTLSESGHNLTGHPTPAPRGLPSLKPGQRVVSRKFYIYNAGQTLRGILDEVKKPAAHLRVQVCRMDIYCKVHRSAVPVQIRSS
jgi:hypothetical protein